MISINQKKYIKSLQQKKYRNLHKVFIVEGLKSIHDFLKSAYPLDIVYSTKALDAVDQNKTVLVNQKELKSISLLKHPKDALAVFKIKENKILPTSGFIIALDDIQDPGNLGTIIRTADWFGVRDIVCSQNTVDCYNPKVIQASMGSLAHVNIFYVELENYLEKSSIPTYGAFMQGNSIYKASVPNDMILVVGNEGNGIREEIEKKIGNRLHIPAHKNSKAESLNAAIATSVILGELHREKLRASSR